MIPTHTAGSLLASPGSPLPAVDVDGAGASGCLQSPLIRITLPGMHDCHGPGTGIQEANR